MYPKLADVAKHVLATLIVIGFFGMVGYILAAGIDFSSSTVTLFIGHVIGLANGLALVVAHHYFPRKDQ